MLTILNVLTKFNFADINEYTSSRDCCESLLVAVAELLLQLLPWQIIVAVVAVAELFFVNATSSYG